MPAVPSLSVVMPLYNNAEHFSIAIESILGQSFGDFECIVIDDASQDGSPALLRSYARKEKRIRAIFLKKNIGLMSVSQMGLEQARAPLIARMDSDDLSLPTRFERQIDFMKRHPEVGMVGCSYFRFKGDPDHKRLNIRLPSMARVSSKSFSYQAVHLKGCFPSSVYRRELALAIGGYRPFFKHGAEDRDFALRMQEKAKFVNLPDILYGYRKNPSSIFVQNRHAMYAAHLMGQLCALYRRNGFPDPIAQAKPLACLPRVLGLPPRVALEDLQRSPLWIMSLLGVWMRERHVSLLPRLFFYMGLLRGCLRGKIGLASLFALIAELDRWQAERSC